MKKETKKLTPLSELQNFNTHKDIIAFLSVIATVVVYLSHAAAKKNFNTEVQRGVQLRPN